MPGLFLAGEITGFALVRTAVTHGVQVVREVARRSRELGVDHSNFLDTGTFANVTLVWTDGEYTDGPGARFRLRRSFGAVAASVGASLLSFEYFDLASGESSYVRQTWFAQLDFTVGDFDGSLTVEQWFGDEEDATAIGIFGQQRF